MTEINVDEPVDEEEVSSDMPPERSRLAIEFSQPRSIDIAMFSVENITAMQLIGLGEYLNWLGKTMLAEDRIRTYEQRIADEEKNKKPSILTPELRVRGDILGKL